MLAIIVTVGVIFYGIDIKQAAKDAEESAKNVRDSANNVKDLQREELRTKDDIEKSKEAVAADRLESGKQLDDTKKLAAQLEDARKDILAKQEQAKGLLDQAEQDLALIEKDVLKAHNKVAPEGVGPSPSEHFSVPELASFYNFPTEFDGRGQTIGLIELGGGYVMSDLDSYFAKLNVSKPQITAVSVGGAANSPGTQADYQVTLDIEVVGAIAPAAHIVVYFAPNTNEGFADAFATAIRDTRNVPTVLSVSWGHQRAGGLRPLSAQ